MSLKYFDKLRSLFHFGNFVLIIWQENRIDVEPNCIMTPNFLWPFCTVIFPVINPQTGSLSDDCDTKCILWFSPIFSEPKMNSPKYYHKRTSVFMQSCSTLSTSASE